MGAVAEAEQLILSVLAALLMILDFLSYLSLGFHNFDIFANALSPILNQADSLSFFLALLLYSGPAGTDPPPIHPFALPPSQMQCFANVS